VDETQSQQPDPVAQLAKQQADFQAQLAQAMQGLSAKIDSVAKATSARPEPKVLAPKPSIDDYRRNNQAVLEKFVEDPLDVLNRTAEDGARRGYEAAKREFEAKLTQQQAREYAERLRGQFYQQNPDLQQYDDWIGGLLMRMPNDWNVEKKLAAAADDVRGKLAQRDVWASSEMARAHIQELNASSAGGRSRQSGQDDDMPMDELSMRRKLAEALDEPLRKRGRVA
jgi:hypothetical protein